MTSMSRALIYLAVMATLSFGLSSKAQDANNSFRLEKNGTGLRLHYSLADTNGTFLILQGTQLNPNGIYLVRTTAVGSYAPNTFGLYDMVGNVWEWCLDRYGSYASGSVANPTGPSSGFVRVIRGGSWYDLGRNCRSAC
jgi:formylglycine-generating enzyme required for sulfatase activity